MWQLSSSTGTAPLRPCSDCQKYGNFEQTRPLRYTRGAVLTFLVCCGRLAVGALPTPTVPAQRFEKLLADKERGMAQFGTQLGQYHSLTLVILARTFDYQLKVRCNCFG